MKSFTFIRFLRVYSYFIPRTLVLFLIFFSNKPKTPTFVTNISVYNSRLKLQPLLRSYRRQVWHNNKIHHISFTDPQKRSNTISRLLLLCKQVILLFENLVFMGHSVRLTGLTLMFCFLLLIFLGKSIHKVLWRIY